MRLNEVNYRDAKPFRRLRPGFLSDRWQCCAWRASGPCGRRDAWGGFEDTATLLALKGEIDVIFVGTGAEIAHLPANFREAFEEAGIGVEPMASPAACRTYNVLLSEGRRIAAALIPV